MNNLKAQEILVSVVIPFYKNIHWLEESVNSVINQTYSNLEILVVNDGSVENIEYIKKYDSRIRILTKENGGPASARNEGIKYAKGKYIAFLDSDDYWDENKIYLQLKLMLENQYKWSHHGYYKFNEITKKIKKVDSSINYKNEYISLYKTSKIQTSSIMVERKVLERNSCLFPIEKRYGQDGIFFLNLARRYKIGYLDSYLSYFRIHGNNAGYRPSVQLHDKAYNYKNYILKDKELLNSFPKQLLLGYRLAYNFEKSCNKIIDLMKLKNKKKLELVYGVLYILPYFIIKTTRLK